MTYGMDTRIGISFQNSYGTSNTASMHWLEPISESVDLKKAQLIRQGLRGIYDEGAHQEGLNTVDGDITIEAKPIPLGVFLEGTMARTTVTSAALYTHTFKPRTADHQARCAERPFTMHKGMGDSGSAHLYSDLAMTNIELAINNGEMLTAKVGIVGGTYAQVAALTPSYGTGSALDWAVSSVHIASVAKANIRDLTLTLDLGLEAKATLATDKYPKRIKRAGFRSATIAGTILFDDQTEYQQFVAQSEQQMVVHIRGASEVQSGYRESISIDIPSMRFTEFPQAVGGPGEIEVGFSAKAVYNASSATALAITLVNTQAGY